MGYPSQHPHTDSLRQVRHARGVRRACDNVLRNFYGRDLLYSARQKFAQSAVRYVGHIRVRTADRHAVRNRAIV